MARSHTAETSNVPKGKINKSGLRNAFRLYKYIKPYRGQYFLGIFFLLGSSLASLAFPKLLGDLVNTGNSTTLGQTLNQTAILIALVLIVQATFSYFRIVLFVNVTERSLAALRQATYRHLIKLPLQFFERRRVGELNSRISADVILLQETMTSTLAEFNKFLSPCLQSNTIPRFIAATVLYVRNMLNSLNLLFDKLAYYFHIVYI